MARKRKITWRTSEPARQPDYIKAMTRMRELEHLVEERTTYFLKRFDALEKRLGQVEARQPIV